MTLSPTHHCPGIFQVSSPKLPLPQHCPGPSRDPTPQYMGWDSHLFSKTPHAKPYYEGTRNTLNSQLGDNVLLPREQKTPSYNPNSAMRMI